MKLIISIGLLSVILGVIVYFFASKPMNTKWKILIGVIYIVILIVLQSINGYYIYLERKEATKWKIEVRKSQEKGEKRQIELNNQLLIIRNLCENCQQKEESNAIRKQFERMELLINEETIPVKDYTITKPIPFPDKKENNSEITKPIPFPKQ